jgi:hypothetical protein
MDEGADITARTQRFSQAARAFTPPSPTRHAKHGPFKAGIVELRQKGASLRLIRELLATADVAVGTVTIARFLAEINGDPIPTRLSSDRATHQLLDFATALPAGRSSVPCRRAHKRLIRPRLDVCAPFQHHRTHENTRWKPIRQAPANEPEKRFAMSHKIDPGDCYLGVVAIDAARVPAGCREWTDTASPA